MHVKFSLDHLMRLSSNRHMLNTPQYVLGSHLHVVTYLTVWFKYRKWHFLSKGSPSVRPLLKGTRDENDNVETMEETFQTQEDSQAK